MDKREEIRYMNIKQKKAFTLIELLVVATILFVLASITLPLIKYLKEGSKEKVEVYQVEKVGVHQK